MSDEPTLPPSPASKPFGPLRLFFAIAGGGIMLFSGGCSLYFLPDVMNSYSGGDIYINSYSVAVIGGVPFLVGLAILMLALKAGR